MGCAALLLCGLAVADKLSVDQRLEIERGLTAEFAITKVLLPHSKKPLPVSSAGQIDKSAWDDAQREGGIAAHVGQQVQITRVRVEANKIILELNGGGRGNAHWYDHLQVGTGNTLNNVGNPNAVNGKPAPGVQIALVFPKTVPIVDSAQIRQILAPILNFDKKSATQQYVDSLPAPVQQAIKQQHAIVGMDRDMVLLAMGKPHGKSRETDKDGNDIEDWIYGEPPGKVTFVRFSEGKVVKIENSYANVGGVTAPPLPEPRQ